MIDLVARLRKNSYDLLHAGAIDPGLPGDGELMIEAADRIEELERLVQNSTIEWASNWDLYDDVCRRKEPTP